MKLKESPLPPSRSTNTTLTDAQVRMAEDRIDKGITLGTIEGSNDYYLFTKGEGMTFTDTLNMWSQLTNWIVTQAKSSGGEFEGELSLSTEIISHFAKKVLGLSIKERINLEGFSEHFNNKEQENK